MACIIVAPGMNSCMLDHPITANTLIRGRVGEGANPDKGWIEVLWPQVKELDLACGDFRQRRYV